MHKYSILFTVSTITIKPNSKITDSVSMYLYYSAAVCIYATTAIQDRMVY